MGNAIQTPVPRHTRHLSPFWPVSIPPLCGVYAGRQSPGRYDFPRQSPPSNCHLSNSQPLCQRIKIQTDTLQPVKLKLLRDGPVVFALEGQPYEVKKSYAVKGGGEKKLSIEVGFEREAILENLTLIEITKERNYQRI